jgi:xanthine dehydrogenase large subunit
MGGGFGGKESNASWVAGAAALAARLTGRPVKLRLPREVDMVATGKRHGFRIAYEVGFDETGRVRALVAELAANGGATLDHTAAVMTRAMCHVDNAYYLPHARITGLCCRTHTVSNTAFRGYGGPQGVLAMEDAVLRIARALGRSPEAVRAVNFYGGAGRETAPYGQVVADSQIGRCMDEALSRADMAGRRAAIAAFNAQSPVIKRGIAAFPLKFGISFNKPQLNQAGALVHVYTDGSIRLNHGGTEMGQGLFTKVAQVVAEVFQVDLDRIALSATSTAEVPNTSPTAASTGSDLNGWAAHAAATTLRTRMTAVAAEVLGVAPEAVVFRDNQVFAQALAGPAGANRALGFGELAALCWDRRVSLSATGFYATPGLSWDQSRLRGNPFFYFTYGAAVAEVAVDTGTGETRVLRADLVQDAGHSLNPAIDIGQVEGAFVQGMGWLTAEELWWDAKGRLRTAGPSTYKIPGSRDAPAVFNVHLLENAPAGVATVFRSKGIGEPPLLLATAVWLAIRDALGGADLDAPATPERVAMRGRDFFF